MNFTVYKSSAGSGKTFTLVRDFLSLVILQPDAFRSILAITFTNKAANEMKERIIRALLSLEKEPSEWNEQTRNLIKPLADTHNLADNVIRYRATRVIGLILHNYSDLAVSTIDSFMQRVIRTFSIHLDLPHNYEIELDTDALRARAVDRLIDKVGVEPALTELLVCYTETEAEDDKNWRIENDINLVAKSLFREDGMALRQTLTTLVYEDFRVAERLMKEWLRTFENELQAIGEEALKTISCSNLDKEHFTQGEKGIYGFFQKLSLIEIEKAMKPNSHVKKAIEEDIWTKASQNPAIVEMINGIKDSLREQYSQASSILQSDYPVFRLYNLLLKQLYPTAVLSEVEKIIHAIKEEENILPISEFNRIVAGVTMVEPVPFIYERLGTRFRHFMIDEFQDTSVLQWYNLLPLIDNSLASNNANLVVGDGKQAIYRWRNGEVEQFINLPKLLNPTSNLDLERQAALARHYHPERLAMNFRSHKAIVQFNNQLFPFLSGLYPNELARVYEDVVQEIRTDKPNGYVQINFMHTDKNQDWTERQCLRVLEIIKDTLADGYVLSDIALLCYKNETCSLLARYLLQNGIAVISSESLLLGSSAKVRLVMVCMRLVINPSDHLAYAEALRLLQLLGLVETAGLHQTMLGVLTSTGHSSKRIAANPRLFEKFLNENGIPFSQKLLAPLGLYDMAEELIRLLALQQTDDIYLQFFVEEIHNKLIKSTLRTDNLVSWWDEKGSKKSVSLPENINAVTVMTIHKSKGLQFPVVIFPFAHTQVKFKGNSTWVALGEMHPGNIETAYLPFQSLGDTPFAELKQAEEEKMLLDLVNLLYVACTRPEDRLYVITKAREQSNSNKKAINEFLADFASSLKEDFEAIDGAIFQYGDMVRKIQKDAQPAPDASQALPQPSDALPATTGLWKSKVVQGTRAPEWWQGSDQKNARTLGSLVHSILSRIKTLAEADNALDDLLVAGEIDPALLPELRQMINSFQTNTTMQQVFEPVGLALAESEILLPDGQVYRPDRLVIQGRSCNIYEFKTGAPYHHHIEQLKGYMNLMKLAGYDEVNGKLIYLDDDCRMVDLGL